MAIVIKKRISLEFLGEDYKDSYLVFKSISISEYDTLLQEIEAVGDDNKQAIKEMLKILQDQFIDGKFLDSEVKKEDLQDFDVETIINCFELFSGGTLDPKV